MKKVYVLIYSNSMGSRDELKECLDNIDAVKSWRYDLPNSFYIISDASAKVIGRQIRDYLGDKRFFITEITNNKQGWLPKDTWSYINKITK